MILLFDFIHNSFLFYFTKDLNQVIMSITFFIYFFPINYQYIKQINLQLKYQHNTTGDFVNRMYWSFYVYLITKLMADFK